MVVPDTQYSIGKGEDSVVQHSSKMRSIVNSAVRGEQRHQPKVLNPADVSAGDDGDATGQFGL